MPWYKFVLRDAILVMAGGALGSLLRYTVSIITHYETSSPFPYKTLIVNVIGCFLVGLVTMLIENHSQHQMIHLFFITGFMGAFTTFSAFSYETVLLYQAGHLRTALLNIVVSMLAGVAAVVGGLWTGYSLR